MDPTMVSFTVAVLRGVFPKEVASVGEAHLYRVISEDAVLTQPKDGRPFHIPLEVLTLAAPFVPLIVEIIKAMKPEERNSSEKVTKTVLIVVADRRESARLKELHPQALDHLVSSSVSAVLKNLEKL